jgi:diguanylate cyclase (GGDEF) domain/uncharacterized domain HDIG
MGNFAYISISALGCYLFLLMAFIASKKNKIINAFIIVLASAILWVGGSFLMRIQMQPSIEFWYYVSINGLMLLCWAFMNFLYAFIDSKKMTARILGAIGTFGIIVLNTSTGLLLAAPTTESLPNGSVQFVYEDITAWIAVMFVVCGAEILDMLILLIKCSKSDFERKHQFRPIMLGQVLIFVGQLLLLLPIFKGFPIDILSGVVCVFCMFYALYRRRMFKLTLLISKGSCYLISAIISALIFANFVIPFQSYIKIIPQVESCATLITAILFTLMTVLIYYLMKALLDRIVTKDEILRSDTIKKFSVMASTSLRIDEILDSLVGAIRDIIPARRVYVCISQYGADKSDKYKTVYTIGKSTSPLDRRQLRLDSDNPLIASLRNSSECILMEDFRHTSGYKSMWEEEKRQFNDLSIECAAPLYCDGELIGAVLLSEKEKNTRYTYDDLTFLASLSGVASIAVKNSRMYEKAYMEARTDELTGLLNRKYFYETLDKLYSENPSASLALIILSLDDFKLYNQLYGNHEGDLALQRVASIIKATVGGNGNVARYSGKEFAIILPDYDILAASNLAENIRRQILNINKNLTSSEYTLKMLTVSGGVSAIPYSASTVRQLIDSADMAVFQVKRNNKNAIIACTSTTMKPNSGEKREITREKRIDIYSEYAPTIYALTAAINTKDHYTFNHSKNVAYYSSELAYACGMTDDSVEIIREAALLHDIGKIGIHESILNKPGRLTEEEFEKMKGHVENSVGIIRNLPSLDYVIPAVIGHHERWDGKGYPRRIAGEDIPLSARILCIADSFDAMISSRSYKSSYTVAYALSELEKNSGLQFDPKLAEIFVRLIRSGEVKPIVGSDDVSFPPPTVGITSTMGKAVGQSRE